MYIVPVDMNYCKAVHTDMAPVDINCYSLYGFKKKTVDFCSLYDIAQVDLTVAVQMDLAPTEMNCFNLYRLTMVDLLFLVYMDIAQVDLNCYSMYGPSVRLIFQKMFETDTTSVRHII